MRTQSPRPDRLVVPVALTLFTVLLGAIIFLAFGLGAALIYALPLPFGLFLLWMSRNVPSHEERLASAENAAAPLRTSTPPRMARLEERHA